MSGAETGDVTSPPAQTGDVTSPPAPPEESSMVPEKILESVRGTLAYTEEVKTGVLQLLAVTEDDLAEMPPLLRARAYLLLAKTATTLLSVQMRCSGIDPDEHPISKEFDRLSLCGEKLGRFQDWDKAPLKPSARINTRAAARVIGHSLPQLTTEQREELRDISRGNEERIKLSSDKRAHKKRRQSQSQSQVKSVRKAAEEFLEKAAKELLSGTRSGTGTGEVIKGPLRNLDLIDQDQE